MHAYNVGSVLVALHLLEQAVFHHRKYNLSTCNALIVISNVDIARSKCLSNIMYAKIGC